jgi:membrane protein
MLSVVVGALALLGPGVRDALKTVADWIPALSGLKQPPTLVEKLVRAATRAALSLGYVSALYWVAMPPRARKTTPILPGAFVAVVLQRVLTLGYGEYVSRVGTGDAYTAGLAIVALTLIGLYLFAVALLVGGLVNRTIGRPTIPCSVSSSEPSKTPAVSQR